MLKKTLLILMSAVILFCAICSAPVAFAEENDATAAQFGIDRTYLCAGDALTVNNPQDYDLKFFVGEEEIDGDSLILSADHYEKWITVKAYSGDECVAEDSVYFSKLPVLYINTDDGEPIVSKEEYKSGEMFIQNNAAVAQAVYDGSLSIKGRGNSTWSWPKKPYRIKLNKKTDLFGMGKNKNWVLLANYLDECYLRSDTAFRISEELGLTTVKSVWTDVILNGEYVGNYQLCEQIRIDEGRVEVFDWEDEAESVASAVSKAEKKKGNTIDKDALEDYLKENFSWITEGTFDFDGKTYIVADYYDAEDDISGGYLFELSEEYDEITRFTTDAGLKVMVKSPEYLGTNSDMAAYVKQYWQWLEDAYRADDGYVDTDDGRVHYSELADIDSMVSYWLVMEIMGNNDAAKKSRFAYKDIGGRIVFGPAWDFDWGCGSSRVGTYASAWKLTLTDNSQNFFMDFVDDPLFIAKATEKYWQIRPFLERLIVKGGILDSEVEYLLESGLADHERWDRFETWNHARGFKNDASQFIGYLRRRVNWLDKQFATDDALLTSTYTTLSAAPYQRNTDELAITLVNASPDTAEHAPSDGAVGTDWNVAVNVRVNQPETSAVNVYVNGLYYRSIPCAGGSISFSVDGDRLYTEENKKNVISLIGKNSAGETVCRNFATVTRMEEAGLTLLGDADGNGVVESIDVTYIQRCIAQLDTPFTQADLMRADVDQNGALELIDVTCIQRYLAGMDTSYPIGTAIS